VARQFAAEFPTPPDLFTINSLGGWTTVDKSFFGTSGSITKIEQAAGVPTVSS
jgi:ABC-type sulfate transport system substrate-binding protein